MIRYGSLLIATIDPYGSMPSTPKLRLPTQTAYLEH